MLREDVRATAGLPPGDNLAMDGYAARAEDVARAPVTLRVIEDIHAAVVASRKITAGTASRIMTGALMPDGANAVVQAETDGGSESGAIRRGHAAGEVVLRASDLLRSACSPAFRRRACSLAGGRRSRS